MRSQSWLVLFLVVIVASCHSLPSDDHDDKIDQKENEIVGDIERDPKIPMAQDPRFNKMLPYPRMTDNQLETATKAEKAQKKTPTTTVVKDETSTIGKHSRTRGR
jgi:hypothetical protein